MKEKPTTYNSNSNSLSMSCISPNHSNYDKIQRNHKSNNKISTKKNQFSRKHFHFTRSNVAERLLTFGRKRLNSATVSSRCFLWHLTGLYTAIAFGCTLKYIIHIDFRGHFLSFWRRIKICECFFFYFFNLLYSLLNK